MAIFVLLLTTLSFVVLLPNQARAQPSASTTWFGALYQSSFTDPYYGVYSLHAYAVGSTVTLYIVVQAESYVANSTYVWAVSFKSDWGGLYFSTAAFPQVLAPGTSYTFKITFSAPDTSTASNLLVHSGTIDVNYSLWATGPKNDQNSNACGYSSAGCYVTYNSDQVSDTRIMQRFGTGSLNGGLLCGDLAGFTNSQANYLCLSALQTFQNGTLTYASGDFSGALPILQQANSLFNQAIAAENNSSAQTAGSLDVGSYNIPLIGLAISILVASVIIAIGLKRRSLAYPTQTSPSPTPASTTPAQSAQ